MTGSLPPSPGVTSPRLRRRPRGWGRALSRRQVRLSLALDQLWEARDGSLWTVFQIHPKDAQVRLVGPGSQPRFVSFAALGRDYRRLTP